MQLLSPSYICSDFILSLVPPHTYFFFSHLHSLVTPAFNWNSRLIIEEPTRVPDTTGQQANPLDIFETSCTDKRSSKGRQIIVQAVSGLTPNQWNPQICISYRKVFRYAKADWYSFGSYMMEVPLPTFFKRAASKTAALSSEVFYIPKNSSQLWFTPECSVATAQKNNYFKIYCKKRCSLTLTTFRTARNPCKIVLENAKCIYARSVQAKDENKQIRSSKFWKISNQIMNRPSPPRKTRGSTSQTHIPTSLRKL